DRNDASSRPSLRANVGHPRQIGATSSFDQLLNNYDSSSRGFFVAAPLKNASCSFSDSASVSCQTSLWLAIRFASPKDTPQNSRKALIESSLEMPLLRRCFNTAS